MRQALLIIDVQNDYFEGGKSTLHQPLQALNHIEQVLQLFRERGLPVIHVQHINTQPGAAFFQPGTDGVLIHEKLSPREHEFLVVKHAPNSFFETNLAEILRENEITQVVLCGMMSHMCIDTSVRACRDFGIKVTLLEDACATKDLSYNGKTIPAETVHDTVMASLSGAFATVMKTADFIV